MNPVPRFSAALVLIGVFGLFAAQPVLAEMKTEKVAGVDYAVEQSMKKNLQSLIGRKISVYLASGQILSGRVKATSTELLHLEKLEGKEFFDALIKIDDISAIDTRFLMPVR